MAELAWGCIKSPDRVLQAGHPFYARSYAVHIRKVPYPSKKCFALHRHPGAVRYAMIWAVPVFPKIHPSILRLGATLNILKS